VARTGQSRGRRYGGLEFEGKVRVALNYSFVNLLRVGQGGLTVFYHFFGDGTYYGRKSKAWVDCGPELSTR